MTENKFARTKELLAKWTIPVGEEREIEIDFAGDKLYFRVKVLSASEISEIRRAGIRMDGTIDPAVVEQANNEFIKKAVIEPEIGPETIHPLLKELLLEELLRIHGYSDEILEEVEKSY
ncbi:hypothetical protein DRP05_12760 [Archaeoglobales archaeon]|nr:MAG: hypothetical protein DRP05_12760 [Archaeoglobales archaeon]